MVIFVYAWRRNIFAVTMMISKLCFVIICCVCTGPLSPTSFSKPQPEILTLNNKCFKFRTKPQTIRVLIFTNVLSNALLIRCDFWTHFQIFLVFLIGSGYHLAVSKSSDIFDCLEVLFLCNLPAIMNYDCMFSFQLTVRFNVGSDFQPRWHLSYCCLASIFIP